MNLALFDFDGTLTMHDSLPRFIQYAVGKPAYYLGLLTLSPMLISYLLGIVSNHFAKERLLAWYFKGWKLDRFEQIAEQYSRQELDAILRDEAIEKLQWHLHRGDRVIVVSASMENWLKPWCNARGVELLATQLAVSNNLLTGKFETANCHGEEKIRRVRQVADIENFDAVYAYGDSSGDAAMLAVANHAFYRKF
ncbi:MAG: HAD-IB family hydrolase [Gammaproteobacteria bacterium]|nr:HAD-IB family hydrolase [Gammaproteobacteria bacterium]